MVVLHKSRPTEGGVRKKEKFCCDKESNSLALDRVFSGEVSGIRYPGRTQHPHLAPAPVPHHLVWLVNQTTSFRGLAGGSAAA